MKADYVSRAYYVTQQTETLVFEELLDGGKTIDELITLCKVCRSTVVGALAQMESRNEVTRIKPKTYFGSGKPAHIWSVTRCPSAAAQLAAEGARA